MKQFYFTYGTENHPFKGGWTCIRAENMDQACALFNALHPTKNGFMDCAGVYTEEQFKKTAMWRTGNFGATCQEFVCYSEADICDYKEFYDYMMTLRGQGLEVLNWHLNGDTEPLDNFFKSACDEAEVCGVS